MRKRRKVKEEYIQMRISGEDNELIEYVCKKLEVSKSKFIRDIVIGICNGIVDEIRRPAELIKKMMAGKK